MICSLVFDVALEVGTRYAVVNFICITRAAHTTLCRFTLREANKTSELS